MVNRSPVVSVIITTHYRNEELQRAIEHVLAQTYEPIELIVVDDSGEAFAESVVETYGEVRYIPHHANKGAIQARQTGFDAASGAYIQFHDDDDWLAPEKIERQVARFVEQDALGVVYCGLEHSNGEVYLPGSELRGNVLREALALYELYPYQTTTSLFRATILDEILPLPRYGGGGDYVLAIESAQRSEFDFVDEVLVHRSTAGEAKGVSLATRKAHIEIIRDHSDLYTEYPGLKDETLAEAYWHLGHAYLNEYRWSVNAIRAFLKANLRAKSIEPKYILSFGTSFLGRWGRDFGRNAVQHLLRFYKLRIKTPTTVVAGHEAVFKSDSLAEHRRVKTLVGEEKVIERLLTDIGPNDIVWDIGANIGTHAVFIGKELSGGQVIAFEPSPKEVSRLRENLNRNLNSDSWTVHEFAVSDTDESAQLALAGDELGEGQHRLTDDGDVNVETHRADTLIEQGVPAPELVKIDVEGAELQVVRGFGDYITDVQCFYIEVHPNQASNTVIEDYLQDRGFSVEVINKRSWGGTYHIRATNSAEQLT